MSNDPIHGCCGYSAERARSSAEDRYFVDRNTIGSALAEPAPLWDPFATPVINQTTEPEGTSRRLIPLRCLQDMVYPSYQTDICRDYIVTSRCRQEGPAFGCPHPTSGLAPAYLGLSHSKLCAHTITRKVDTGCRRHWARMASTASCRVSVKLAMPAALVTGDSWDERGGHAPLYVRRHRQPQEFRPTA
jgi:hypothetical protein